VLGEHLDEASITAAMVARTSGPSHGSSTTACSSGGLVDQRVEAAALFSK
jgi:hypothetical protein